MDGTIAIWDTRVGKSALTSFKAHNADVNVISWNRYVNLSTYLTLLFNKFLSVHVIDLSLSFADSD